MGRQTKSNVPPAALRWSVERAGIEFGVSSNTLRKSLGKNSATPDQDGLFSTAQIVTALYGALHQEKLRTQRQVADRITLENEITRAEVLNPTELMRVLAMISDAKSSRIMAADVPRSVKDDLLTDLGSVPLVLEGGRACAKQIVPTS
jgi:hypothetical protein